MYRVSDFRMRFLKYVLSNLIFCLVVKSRKSKSTKGHRQSFIDEINNEQIGRRFRVDSSKSNPKQAQFGPRLSYSIDPYEEPIQNPHLMQQAYDPICHFLKCGVHCPVSSNQKPWDTPKTQEFTTKCCTQLKVSTSDQSSVINQGIFYHFVFVILLVDFPFLNCGSMFQEKLR